MFERHIVHCEDCWREVDLGRRGRSVAESARELAPQPLRERVRMAVESVTPPRRRPPWVFGAGAVVVAAALLGASLLMPEREPREIEAVLAAFRERPNASPVQPRLPSRLRSLELVDSARTELAGMETVVHTYVDPSGDEVVVFVGDKQWPVASGARHDNGGDTWIAEKDGLVLICIDDPAPSLVVGDDVHDVELAAYALRP